MFSSTFSRSRELTPHGFSGELSRLELTPSGWNSAAQCANPSSLGYCLSAFRFAMRFAAHVYDCTFRRLSSKTSSMPSVWFPCWSNLYLLSPICAYLISPEEGIIVSIPRLSPKHYQLLVWWVSKSGETSYSWSLPLSHHFAPVALLSSC